MSAADVHSILYRGEDPLKKKFVPKNEEKTYVPRHWPGKAPEGAAVHSDSGSEASGSEEEGVEVKQLRMRQVLAEDRRLHRLAAAASAAAAAQGAQRRREAFVIQSEKERQRLEKGIVDAAEAGDSEGEEWEGFDGEGGSGPGEQADRAKLRAAALENRRREERLLMQQQQEEEDESEESEDSDYSEGSEDEQEEADVVLHKPTFVSKANRLTVLEREERHRREQEEQARQQHAEEQRKLETKHMVYAVLAREDEAEDVAVTAVEQQQQQQQDAVGGVGEDDMPDDTDGIDGAQEYEDWKLRELARIKRDKEEREKRGKFLEAVERRRLMTEEERREDDKELDKMQPKREIRHKYHFMQKYYHRGAFFQDLARSGEEPIYLRDFNAPVGEDAVDKKNLPKILQLRRGELARGGRTKHTHLVDVDTSDLSHPWATATREVQGQKLLKKAAANVAACMLHASAAASSKCIFPLQGTLLLMNNPIDELLRGFDASVVDSSCVIVCSFVCLIGCLLVFLHQGVARLRAAFSAKAEADKLNQNFVVFCFSSLVDFAAPLGSPAKQLYSIACSRREIQGWGSSLFQEGQETPWGPGGLLALGAAQRGPLAVFAVCLKAADWRSSDGQRVAGWAASKHSSCVQFRSEKEKVCVFSLLEVGDLADRRQLSLMLSSPPLRSSSHDVCPLLHLRTVAFAASSSRTPRHEAPA
ncbi:hypothetical protein Efla_000287 [Eimeria flavescens]